MCHAWSLSTKKQLILRNVGLKLSADETLPNVWFGQERLMVDDKPDDHFQRDSVKV